MKKPTVTILVLLVMLVGQSPIAQGANELNLNYQETGPQSMPSAFSLLLQLIVGLAVVGALVYVTVRFLRRNFSAAGGGEVIRLLDYYAFGVNKGLYIVAVGDRVFLLGVTEHNITLLEEIKDEAIIEYLLEAAESRGLEKKTNNFLMRVGMFRDRLEALFQEKKRLDNPFEGGQAKDFRSHIQKQIARLEATVENNSHTGRDEKNDEKK
ncbi:MAG: flagellar protein FliO/FliZ [Eubacteriales bacterium]|nr:flagellar protein FliO/FliZ [Eubacteriales bacterium]MDN5363892.1 flagellar protein FliO/FliZ [Eubacteriales bacterium]